jgi:hypothetical protein
MQLRDGVALMEPVYVVALNYTDFVRWCQDHDINHKDRTKVRYITEVHHIQGVTFTAGQVEWTDRWYQHRDADEIRYWIDHRTMRSQTEHRARLSVEAERKQPPPACDHTTECCYVHKVHSNPHRGCILR